MGDSYATRAHLHRYGLPRGALASPARLVEGNTGSVLSLDDHGLADDDELVFRPEGGGALPSPLETGTTYYAVVLTASTFSVAATAGGSVIPLTTSGDRVVVAVTIDSMINAVLEKNSRLFDSYLPAHAVPLEAPYPLVATASVAQLSAIELLSILGQASAAALANAEAVRRELPRLARGIPLRDPTATARENLATTVAVSDDRGWGTGDTIP